MTSAPPRALSWRGRIDADALWFDPDLLGEAALRRRVLALWSPGCSAEALAGGLLLRLPAPRPLDSRHAPGVLLRRIDQVLLALPLTAAERRALSPPPGAVVLLRHGEVLVLTSADAAPIDPATWLDLSALSPVEVAPLGRPPPPPALVLEAPDIHRRLGITPAEELSALLGELHDGSGGEAGAGGWGGMAAGMLRGVQGWLDQAASAMGGSGGGRAERKGLAGWLDRQAGWLDDLAARMGVLDALQGLASQRGARHLRGLLDMFDRGDLDSALRHAIPLRSSRKPRGDAPADAGGLAGGLEDLQSWGWRNAPDFSKGMGGTRRTSSVTLGDALFARLEELYRAAVARLDAQGMHRQAAYVLAELLDVPEEAVDYLVERGEFALAAELADARQMDLPRVVRLWLLADDRRRALLLLRMSDRFADTIRHLEEKGDAERAGWLRRRWAVYLAHAGRYGAAAEAIWPIPAARGQAIQWLDQAIALRGAAGAQAVARRLALDPLTADTRDAWEALLDPYLRDLSPEGAATRVVLARSLVDPSLAWPLLRRLLLDQAASPLPARWEALRALAASADPALSVDLPDGLRQGPAPPRLEHFRIEPGDTGMQPTWDAGLVAGGRVLVALGEGGCLLLGSDGRPEHRFSAPAEKLVLADSGASALALISRGEGRWLVSHLDLAARQERTWLEGVAIEAFAESYDGDVWYIGQGGILMAVDAQLREPRLEALWQSPPHWTRLDSITLMPGGIQALGDNAEGNFVLHHFTLPGPKLDPSPLSTFHPAGTFALSLYNHLLIQAPVEGLVLSRPGLWERIKPGIEAPFRLLSTQPVGRELAVAVPSGVRILEWREGASPENVAPRFWLEAPGARRWQVRLTEAAWVMCDDLGRVVVIRRSEPTTLLVSARV